MYYSVHPYFSKQNFRTCRCHYSLCRRARSVRLLASHHKFMLTNVLRLLPHIQHGSPERTAKWCKLALDFRKVSPLAIILLPPDDENPKTRISYLAFPTRTLMRTTLRLSEGRWLCLSSRSDLYLHLKISTC